MKKEYYKVNEISKMFNITGRYIRAKIQKLKEEKNYNNLIVKNNDGHWLIHDLLTPKFKRLRKQKQPYYAITFDFSSNYTIKDINEILTHVCDSTKINDLEFHYTIEQKKKNNKNHIHAYTNSKKRDLIKNFRIGFSGVGYKDVEIFDLEGWKNYITKDGNKIITIKK